MYREPQDAASAAPASQAPLAPESPASAAPAFATSSANAPGNQDSGAPSSPENAPGNQLPGPLSSENASDPVSIAPDSGPSQTTTANPTAEPKRLVLTLRPRRPSHATENPPVDTDHPVAPKTEDSDERSLRDIILESIETDDVMSQHNNRGGPAQGQGSFNRAPSGGDDGNNILTQGPSPQEMYAMNPGASTQLQHGFSPVASNQGQNAFASGSSTNGQNAFTRGASGQDQNAFTGNRSAQGQAGFNAGSQAGRPSHDSSGSRSQWTTVGPPRRPTAAMIEEYNRDQSDRSRGTYRSQEKVEDNYTSRVDRFEDENGVRYTTLHRRDGTFETMRFFPQTRDWEPVTEENDPYSERRNRINLARRWIATDGDPEYNLSRPSDEDLAEARIPEGPPAQLLEELARFSNPPFQRMVAEYAAGPGRANNNFIGGANMPMDVEMGNQQGAGGDGDGGDVEFGAFPIDPATGRQVNHAPGFSNNNVLSWDQNGFLYSGGHDHCVIPGIHRHNMDGTVSFDGYYTTVAALDAYYHRRSGGAVMGSGAVVEQEEVEEEMEEMMEEYEEEHEEENDEEL